MKITVKDYIIQSMGSEWVDKEQVVERVKALRGGYSETTTRDLRDMAKKAYKGFKLLKKDNPNGKGTLYFLTKELPKQSVQEPVHEDALFSLEDIGIAPTPNYNFLKR